MGNAAYEERRNQQSERMLAEERRAREREEQEAAAKALFGVMVPALKDFFEGKACLIIDPIDEHRTAVRFSRG